MRKRTVYRFLPYIVCTQPCPSDLSAHTHPVCDVCVCARSGSRCIHMGRQRQRLTEGVSEAWCFKKIFELFDSIIIYGYVYSFWYKMMAL